LLDPFELGDFDFDRDFEPDDLDRDDFGFEDRFVDPGFADFGFAAFAFEALGLAFAFTFDFDCGFDFVDDSVLFDADRFFVLFSAIFLSPRGVSL